MKASLAKNTDIYALSVTDLSIKYDEKHVIDNVSFSLESGGVVGLIGLNGAGKTSLMKTILGLRKIQSGDIKIFDQVHDHKVVKYDLAHLPERFSPPWFLTGLEFLKFSLGLYGKNISNDQLCAAAESIALEPQYLNKRVNTYSKGMRQKLGLIATILTQCRLIILDEPMSGLDPQARLYVKNFIQTYKTDAQTIFLSSHILEDMDDLCDRIVVLHGGVLLYDGAPKTLKTQQKEIVLEKAFLKLIEP